MADRPSTNKMKFSLNVNINVLFCLTVYFESNWSRDLPREQKLKISFRELAIWRWIFVVWKNKCAIPMKP